MAIPTTSSLSSVRDRTAEVDRETKLRLYGTDEALVAPRRLVAGPLAITIADGSIRTLAWHGIEVLRGIDYPIRNADWGTWAATTTTEDFDEAGDGFTYRRDFTVGDGLFRGSFTCSGTPQGAVAVALKLMVQRDARVNRAGFVLLHPVAGVAGSPLRVTHADGSMEETCFPELISASQPIFDIAAMRQEANGVTANLVLSGDTFEMEDQRNWSDASYKTYCRPLSLPYPYEVLAGELIEQSIDIQMAGTGGAGSAVGGAAIDFGPSLGRALPEPTLALEAGWETRDPALAALGVAATLLRVDLTDPHWPASLPCLLGSAHGALDLEVIVGDDAAAMAQSLVSLRTVLEQAHVVPRSVIALPQAYLRSYQPQASWPSGATPEQAADAARAAFPDAAIGGGVLTNFTELNRYRGAVTAGDYLTHGTTAIVHAADDVSVLQTLEALPQIFASIETLAPGRPYRLGLVSIGMRSNPYGAAVAENPDGLRTPMAMSDPRLSGLFGAAFMVGVVAATVDSPVERMALAAPAGPLGLIRDGQVCPAWHVFAGLTRLKDQDRLVAPAPDGMAAVATASASGQALVLANLGAEHRHIELGLPGRAVLLDTLQPNPGWLAHAPRRWARSLSLSPFAVAFVSFGAHDFFGASS